MESPLEVLPDFKLEEQLFDMKTLSRLSPGVPVGNLRVVPHKFLLYNTTDHFSPHVDTPIPSAEGWVRVGTIVARVGIFMIRAGGQRSSYHSGVLLCRPGELKFRDYWWLDDPDVVAFRGSVVHEVTESQIWTTEVATLYRATLTFHLYNDCSGALEAKSEELPTDPFGGIRAELEGSPFGLVLTSNYTLEDAALGQWSERDMKKSTSLQ